MAKQLDEAHAEIGRLRAEIQQHNDAIWVGLERAKDIRSATIEECARVADNVGPDPMAAWIAAAIRALKNK